MILELRLSNMFSLRDEVTLDMQAAKIQTQKARMLEGNVFSVGGEKLLKSMAVFGANASGKSNVIKAIRGCVEMIRSLTIRTFVTRWIWRKRIFRAASMPFRISQNQ